MGINKFSKYEAGTLCCPAVFPVRLRDKIEFQILIRPFPVQINVKVKGRVARSGLALSEPYWFF